VYLAELLYRLTPDAGTLARYRDLVLESADALASMVWLDPARGPLCPRPSALDRAGDPRSRDQPEPFVRARVWRWALGVAQKWRERLGLPREAHWDDVLARLSPLPVKDGKYVALESSPDTWDAVESRHDHPAMLMALGFLPGGPTSIARPWSGRSMPSARDGTGKRRSGAGTIR
jgi:hypothetical protein